VACALVLLRLEEGRTCERRVCAFWKASSGDVGSFAKAT
jgi:hypothetical protein